MRKAEYIVACLLEATSTGTTLRFGPGDSPYGKPFASFEQALMGKRGDSLLADGYSFVVQKNPGDVGVYSAKPQVLSQEGVVDFVCRIFGLKPETQVHVAQSFTSGTKPIPLQDVFLERKVDRKTGRAIDEPTAAPTTPPQQAAPVAQPTPKLQPKPVQPKREPKQSKWQATEPEEEPIRTDPEREAYVRRVAGQPVTQNVPLDFGLDVDTSTGRDAGVVVAGVIPGGSAAKGDVQAGDRIVQIGPFETDRGSWGPWRIRNLADFKVTTGYMQPNHTVPMRVVRGGTTVDLSVRPEVKKIEGGNRGAEQISGAEAQAYGKKAEAAQREMAQNKNDLSHFTVGQLSQLFSIPVNLVQGTLDSLGVQAKDYAPGENPDYAPNEQEPASVTGNQPANPSALT